MGVNRRREIFFDVFTARKVTALNGSQTPFAIFVKKLQESLTRMESFEVVTVAQSIDGPSFTYLIEVRELICMTPRLKEKFPVATRTATPFAIDRC